MHRFPLAGALLALFAFAAHADGNGPGLGGSVQFGGPRLGTALNGLPPRPALTRASRTRSTRPTWRPQPMAGIGPLTSCVQP